MEIFKKLFALINRIEGYFQISQTGYVEHFIIGALIAGLIAFLYFDKTKNALKSVVLGITTAFFVGLIKEYVDPLVGGDKDKMDLIFTILGSFSGVILFFLFSFIKKKYKG